MKFSVLALDYDGTVADNGHIAAEVREAVADVRARGIVVLLVTGRIAADLHDRIGDLRLFDAVVAENGAVVLFPESGRTQVLGSAPPPAFLDELRRQKVELRVGECVVEAEAGAASIALQALRTLQLPLALAFNRDRLMVLPPAVSKATGLREALGALRLSAHNAVAIGDAENDHALLAAVELGSAVSWGSAALKAVADEVVPGSGPKDVAPYVRELASHERLPPERIGRRALLLGRTPDGQPLALAIRGRNVLIAGEPRSGKSWVAGLLCEQLVLHRYSVCVIDPEGDYRALEVLPGVVVEEVGDEALSVRRLHRLLRYPDLSLVLDLSRVPASRKQEIVHAVLKLLAGIRHEAGLPHRIVLDEAHHFLHRATALDLLDLSMGGYTLVTYRVSALHPDIRKSAEAVIVTRETDGREIDALKWGCGGGADWTEILPKLELEEAVLLPGADEACGVPKRFRIAPRLTRHVRHRQKYLDVPVPESQAFVFQRNGARNELRTRTLDEFARVIADSNTAELEGYLKRGDLSRWLEDVFADHPLATRIRELENQFCISRVPDIQDALVQVIRERYGFAPEPLGAGAAADAAREVSHENPDRSG